MRPVVRGENLALVLLQLRRGKPLRVHQRLLALVVRRRQRQVRLRDLDVIAEDRVIAHLQRADSRPLPLAIFDGRNRLPPGGRNRSQLIQLRVHSRRNRAAIDQRQRRLGHQRLHNPRRHVVERVETCGDRAPPRRRHRVQRRLQSRQPRQARGQRAHIARPGRIQRNAAPAAAPDRESRQTPAESLRASADRRAPRPPPHSALQSPPHRSAAAESSPAAAACPSASGTHPACETASRGRPGPEKAAPPVPDSAPSPGPVRAPSSAPRNFRLSMCSASFFCVVRT